MSISTHNLEQTIHVKIQWLWIQRVEFVVQKDEKIIWDSVISGYLESSLEVILFIGTHYNISLKMLENKEIVF